MKTVLLEEQNRIDLVDGDDKKIGEIEFKRSGSGELYATSTEVKPGHEGKGYGKMLLDALVRYAREKGVKIVPICPFVKKIFVSYPEKYGDVAQIPG